MGTQSAMGDLYIQDYRHVVIGEMFDLKVVNFLMLACLPVIYHHGRRENTMHVIEGIMIEW